MDMANIAVIGAGTWGTALAARMPDDFSTDFRKRQIFLKDGTALPCYNITAYTELLRELILLLPPEVTIHRVTGDPPRSLLLYPAWTADKKKTMNYIRRALSDSADPARIDPTIRG